MRAYRWSVRLKLGLIVFAMVIALASLWYTNQLVERLRDREQSMIQLWADAQAQVAQAQDRATNPHRTAWEDLEQLIDAESQADLMVGTDPEALREALAWARSMPPTGELDFILNEILEPNPFAIPAIITDSTQTDPLFWRNVSVPDDLTQLSPEDSVKARERLDEHLSEMKQTFEPIPIKLSYTDTGTNASAELTQYVFYNESGLVRELRLFPYVQLGFVGLFILVGYLGFSYVRRSEQSSLWVGMAREAAHQLGTPISSLMGWTQLLRSDDLSEDHRDEALTEIENDIERLQRVANRFSDIGSMPKLEPTNVATVIHQTADYIRRRIPQHGQAVTLKVHVPDRLQARVNEELFAWVLENLLKNALDALEGTGEIRITAEQAEDLVSIEVADTGSGIERRARKNIFRPGFSTKERGWGLGLSLAQRVIENYHGGSLQLAESTVGEGSTFRIQLPTASSDA
ncbi:MAG: HAMP domain-containing sensor histidine kinase [Longimonas sp.]|uniref:sensor histidine kinase n=1 Tax=Longimonas sp. TaxID=2039626 RepID=UPI0039763935